MDSLDAITLIAFLAALMRLDSGLPPDLQHQLNEIGKAFPSDISKLDAIAESYSPLEQEYMEARLALQQKEGERLRFSVPEPEDSSEISDEQIINFAVDVLKASDSVNLLKQKAQESTRLGQLLFQLKDAQITAKIPEQSSLRKNPAVRRLSEFYGALPATRAYPGKEAIRQEAAEQLAKKVLSERE